MSFFSGRIKPYKDSGSLFKTLMIQRIGDNNKWNRAAVGRFKETRWKPCGFYNKMMNTRGYIN